MKQLNITLLIIVLFIVGLSGAAQGGSAGHIAHVWANEGSDKVWRSELRATHDPSSVLNSVWDGTRIALFGARNEVVSFNLILEAPTMDATNVSVSLPSLSGPGGATITTRPATGNDLFNYTGRNIELFYVRYLQIQGLSIDLAYNDYDERHIPERCRRPHDENGIGSGTWQDRPCHDQLYPEIAVPLELHTPFTIPAGTNQAIWGDITIPKTAPSGSYSGTITITENGSTTWQIPIQLQVRDFTLPDLPSARTMVYYSFENINDRYLGQPYPDPGTAAYAQSQQIIDRHFQLAHRHRLSLIDGSLDTPADMNTAWIDRLSGALFTPARGYDGPGVGVGNNVFSIGTYGGWSWRDGTQADMWSNTDAWINWIDSQSFTTPTDYFLYLIDESEDYPQIEQWVQWMDSNPGPGRRLPSMATIALPDAINNVPNLDIPTSGAGFGITADWENALATLRADPTKRFWMYNGSRPGSGSFATEDEGVALRELTWSQFKVGAERWFYWESTYYVNFQCYAPSDPQSQTNVFQQAQTFGCYERDDPSRGRAGWNYFNGDGVLFYPGTDTRYPAESYGLEGPFASLRMKLWRRGLQDYDYLTLAAAIHPTRTQQIVQRMVPTVLWEYGVDDPSDPTWVRTDIRWSTDPDDWEVARAELADIIDGGTASTATPPATSTPMSAATPTSSPTPSPTTPPPPSPPQVAGCSVFPTDNIWNVPVDTLPVDPNSAAYIDTIGTTAYIHADFGSGDWPPGSGSPIGIPYTDVPGTQPKVTVTFDYADESDAGPYPIPPNPPIEGGPDSDGDRHILIVDRDNCTLYELYDAWPQPDGNWQAGSGAIFDLNSNALRPAGWTSADAAGLPILPGLVRYDEVASGEIRHAIRVTAPQTRRAYVWPARHFASSLTGSQYPPMGQRFRLKADFDISGFSPETQVILRALKKYGLVLADNGAPWFISGAPDERWDNDVLHELHQVQGSDFEAVDVSSLMVDPDSAQVKRPASECVGDTNGNGTGDVVDIMTTLVTSGCRVHLSLVTNNWRRPWTPALSDVNDFLYQLQNLDLPAIGNTAYDLVVMDYSADGSEAGEFTADSITALKYSPGGEKIVLAYMSIGEAEDYRFYWQASWEPGNPAWLDAPNPDWPGNYKVHYWDPAWQAIIFEYTNRLLNAGFDGAYLDLIDAYEYYADQGRTTAAQEMADFVAAIAAHAHARDPTFYIVPQNAPELATLQPAYLNSVDSIGQEDIYYGYAGDDQMTPPAVTAELEAYLNVFKGAGKPVLTIDYATTPAKVDDAYAKSQAKGYIPFVTVRDLDQLIIHPGHEPD